ncbi:MAG: HD domain-containing protein [Thermodesulfobacteriota bacterium]|nr:HD domain-containing protein [Thermodesulfobacteriota bacterium]
MKDKELLLKIRNDLDQREEVVFSQWACLSRHAVRRREEKRIDKGHRQSFSVDTDRVLHSLAYSRYIDKTQVFYLIKNDHITHRVLHVQLVSKIARTIGRLLALNEDLIEAIALGHDIGHTPFGHDGEKMLLALCESHQVGQFLHNIQSVRFLQEIENKGKGLNLTLQVLDGIFCHNGELHSQALEPFRNKDFKTLDDEMRRKAENPFLDIWPMTLEGCVVRMADTISYVGRDIEDAVRLGLIDRKDLPEDCKRVLGDTNGTIVYTLVEDLVANSLAKPYVSFSSEVGEALRRLKGFNEEHIYNNQKIKRQTSKIKLMFELLFEKYLQDLETENEESNIFMEYLDGMSSEYIEKTPPAGIVRDFIVGMTDEYFLDQCKRNLIPQIKPDLF